MGSLYICTSGAVGSGDPQTPIELVTKKIGHPAAQGQWHEADTNTRSSYG